jgi:hypothetical protein
MSLERSAKIAFYISSLKQSGALDVVYKPKLESLARAYQQAPNDQAGQASIQRLMNSAAFNELTGDIDNMMAVDSILTEAYQSDFDTPEFSRAFAIALIQVLLAE